MTAQLNAQLLAYYTQQPATGQQPEILDLQALTNGWASSVYSFTLRYRDADEVVSQRLVLKMYNDNMDGIDRALKERHALYHLRAARYPVPGVVLVETDPAYLGRPFIVMERIEGRLLADRLAAADERERRELVQLFVGLMTSLHKLGPLVLVPRMQPVSSFALVNREVHTLRGLANQYDRPELLPLVEWLYERRKAAPTAQPVITHRDFHPWNVLVTDSGIPYVIDWGWQVSDARYDLAWTLTLLARSGEETLRDLVLAEYERVTGGAVEALAYFETLATTRWLFDISHSLRTGDALRDGAGAAFRMAMVEPARQAVDLLTTRTALVLPSAEWFLNG